MRHSHLSGGFYIGYYSLQWAYMWHYHFYHKFMQYFEILWVLNQRFPDKLFVRLCSIGFYQMAKIAVTPTIVLAEFMIFNKKVSSKKVINFQHNCTTLLRKADISHQHDKVVMQRTLYMFGWTCTCEGLKGKINGSWSN